MTGTECWYLRSSCEAPTGRVLGRGRFETLDVGRVVVRELGEQLVVVVVVDDQHDVIVLRVRTHRSVEYVIGPVGTKRDVGHTVVDAVSPVLFLFGRFWLFALLFLWLE